MCSKNGEAQKCANTLGLLSNKSGKGNIDMNIVAKSDLNFQGIHLQPVENMAETWLTAIQIGYALQYSDDKAVQRIYSRHADEFTEKMTGVVKVTTPYGEQMTRAFSLRGAHLIAMFARTTKAKEFRRWVLDVLEKEVLASPILSDLPAEGLDITLSWWYENNLSLRVNNPPQPKRPFQTPSLNVQPYMMYGDDAKSPTLHLVSILEEMGFDLSGPRSEVEVMRTMLRKMYPEIREIDAIRRVSKARNVYVRGAKGELLLS
ncbi:Bro-N domain-containing protein [Enterobacter sp. Ag1]|uniref:BRO-N domain-containing protein n=2 Tax=Enterobacteriaceae TaxID=543 RepID=UPI000272B063|nr:Bro-N domain-containing protein [Enterobacter sp. Ag1]EJF31692.1 hypothetical protein A936_08868 [Enterobacter sp. Ag1]